MRGLKFVILGVAVAAGVGAVALVQNELERARQAAAVVAPTDAQDAAPVREQIGVLVAQRDLPRGTRLTAEHFRWQLWPADSVTERFITRASHPEGIDLSTNAIVRADIVEGEPVTETKLVRLDHPGVLSAMIRPGMRAFAIALDVETGAGGFILPGDFVDVILTRTETVPTMTPDGRWGERDVLFTDTLLRTVRVLAVDTTFQADGDDATTDMRDTATLEVTPAMAELLSLSEEAGRITLALRSITELVDGDGQVIFDPTPTLAVDLESFAGASLGGASMVADPMAADEPKPEDETPAAPVAPVAQAPTAPAAPARAPGEPRTVTVIRWSDRSEARLQ